MHELSVMQSALDIAVDHAKRQGAQRIHLIKLRVGALSGVVPDALEFAFDITTQGTMAEGAKLDIERVAAACYCPACDIEFEPEHTFYECPRCKSLDVKVRRGRELDVASLEVS